MYPYYMPPPVDQKEPTPEEQKNRMKAAFVSGAGVVLFVAATVGTAMHLEGKGEDSAEAVQKHVDTVGYSKNLTIGELVPNADRREKIDSLVCHEIMSHMPTDSRHTQDFAAALEKADQKLTQDVPKGNDWRESLYTATLMTGYKSAFNDLSSHIEKQGFMDNIKEKADAVKEANTNEAGAISIGDTIQIQKLRATQNR